MAEIIPYWYVTNQAYTENVSVANGGEETWTGETRGVVSLVKEWRVTMECRVLRMDDVPALLIPLPEHDLEVKYRARPDEQTLLTALTGRNAILGTDDVGSWYPEGGVQFQGYGDNVFSTQVYRATFVSQAVDVKFLAWYGRMTADRFNQLQSLPYESSSGGA